MIRPKEDKWNDFDEMIRRINSNLSTENGFELDSSNIDTNPCETPVENNKKVNEKEFIQVSSIIAGHAENDTNCMKSEESNFVNKQIQSIKLASSNNVSEDNSEKELTLRMSEDDIEEEQIKITQQHEEAQNGIIFSPPGKF